VTTALPVLEDLSTRAGRSAWGLTDAALETDVVPLRLREGDDASCLSLARPQEPQLLGVDPTALAAEVIRLRRVVADLEADQRRALEPTTPDLPVPAPGADAVECVTCKQIAGIGGRMIASYSTCKFCGQTWEDAKLGKRTPPPPDKPERSSGIAGVAGGDDDGWQTIYDSSQDESPLGQSFGNRSIPAPFRQ